MTQPLYDCRAFSILPKRGRYTPAEVLQEWEELISNVLDRHRKPRTDDSQTAEETDAVARDLYICSARDVAILVPIIAGDEQAEAALHDLEAARDSLREIIS